MNEESKIFGISGRGWLALIIISTMCIMSALEKNIGEPLNSIAILTIGFYFGQKGKA